MNTFTALRRFAIAPLFFVLALIEIGSARAGTIDREFFDLIGRGTAIVDLVNSGRLDTAPDAIEPLTQGLKTPANTGDEYGSRIRGFIQAPATGDYTFFIRSDDASQLSISTDHQSAAATVIARETGCCAPLYSGDRLDQRRSAPRRLERGKVYYIEILQKEGLGDDYVEVGWQRPDGGRETVPASVLMPWAPNQANPQIDEQPKDVETLAGNPVVLSVTVRVAQPATFRWLKNGLPVSGADLQTLTIPTALVADSGLYTCEITAPNGTKATSAAARVTVAPDTAPPTVVTAELDAKGELLRVTFSEPLAAASATALANFSLNNNVTLSNAQLSSDSRIVLMKTSALSAGTKDYLLAVRGVTDVSANVIAQTTVPVLLTVTEPFAADLGIFDKTKNTAAAGISFKASPTGNAGSQPGELGGLITRRSTANAVYVATTRLGGVLSLSQDLVIRGKMIFRNRNFDGSLSIGYLPELESLGGVVGFNFAEPNSATAPAFRGFISVTANRGELFPWPNGNPVDFEFTWLASSGTAIARVNGETHVREVGPSNTELRTFIIGSWSASDTSQTTEWFIDDLTFTVATVPGAPAAVDVTLTEPAPGRSFPAGADVTIAATPTATQGTITKVEFFVTPEGGTKTKIGEATQSPYATVWRRVAPGNYSVSATASNDAGASASTIEAKITVEPARLVTTVTESFNTGLGNFDFELRNRENGNDFGFSASNNTGGTAGELGGTLIRTMTVDAGLVGDSSLGGSLNPATQRLIIKAKFKIVSANFDGGCFVGYINTQNLGVRLGLNFSEPGGGFQPNYRASLVIPGGGGPIFGLEPNVTHQIDLVWDPIPQTLSGKIGPHAVTLTGNAGQATLDAFVLASLDAGSTDPNLAHQVFLDDVTYSVVGVPSLTENFDSSLGAFDGARNNTVRGNNFGFSNTSNAGGRPGEAGGTLARTTLADAAYIGDLTLGGLLGQSEPLIMKGRFFLQTGTFDGDMFIGYADTSNLANRMGISIAEPGGTVAPNLRVRAFVNGKTTDIIGVAPDRAWQFDLAWTPADGVFKGTIAGQAVTLNAGPGNTLYDSFIMGAFGAGSNNPQQNGKLFIDELTYNIVSDAPSLTVRLKEPAIGSRFASGTDISLSAEAATQMGNIQRIEFFAKATGGADVKIGETTSAPFTLAWRNVAAGEYALTAKVTTDTGQTATSAEVKVTVIFVPPVGLRLEGFDGGLGAFKSELRNHENGNDFGFSNTQNAGGKAGELGGILARTVTANAGYVADTNLGGRLLPAFQNLVLRGKLFLNNVNFDGDMYIGYADTANLSTFMGVRINEPGGGVQPNYRGFVTMPGAATAIIALAPNTVHEFDLAWNATARTFTGKLGGQDVAISGDPGNASFDAVLVGAYGAGSPNADQKGELFVDDLSYSVVTDIVAVPQLTIARAGLNIVLSWTGAGFKLQFRDGFEPGAAWADAAGQVVSQAGGFSVTITPTARARFWRLTR